MKYKFNTVLYIEIIYKQDELLSSSCDELLYFILVIQKNEETETCEFLELRSKKIVDK